jgi:hypothetical protein
VSFFPPFIFQSGRWVFAFAAAPGGVPGAFPWAYAVDVLRRRVVGLVKYLLLFPPSF